MEEARWTAGTRDVCLRAASRWPLAAARRRAARRGGVTAAAPRATAAADQAKARALAADVADARRAHRRGRAAFARATDALAGRAPADRATTRRLQTAGAPGAGRGARHARCARRRPLQARRRLDARRPPQRRRFRRARRSADAWCGMWRAATRTCCAPSRRPSAQLVRHGRRAGRRRAHGREARRSPRSAELAGIRARLGERRALLAGVRADIRARRHAPGRRATPADHGPTVEPADGVRRRSGRVVAAHPAGRRRQRGQRARHVPAHDDRVRRLGHRGRPGGFFGLFQYAPTTWKGSWNPYRSRQHHRRRRADPGHRAGAPPGLRPRLVGPVVRLGVPGTLTSAPLLMLDHDGVVVDSLEVFSTAFIEACRQLGIAGVETQGDVLALFEGNVYESLRAAGADDAQVVEAVRRSAAALRLRAALAAPVPAHAAGARGARRGAPRGRSSRPTTRSSSLPSCAGTASTAWPRSRGRTPGRARCGRSSGLSPASRVRRPVVRR